MKRNIILSTVLIMIILASQSFAGNVFVNYLGAGEAHRAITYPGHSGTYWAGLYRWQIGSTKFNTYCIDFLGNGASFWGTTENPADVYGGAGKLWTSAYSLGLSAQVIQEKYSMIGWLYQNIHPTLTTGDQRANLNLAFWEIGLDYTGGSATSLASGNFQSTSYASVVDPWLQSAFDYGRTGFIPYIITPYDPKTAQEIINPVPEPGTLLLLGTGLLGFGVFARLRRRRKD